MASIRIPRNYHMIFSVLLLLMATISCSKMKVIPVLNEFAVGSVADQVLATSDAHQQASDAAQAAVSAYAQAVATCSVNVSCDQAKNQLIQVKSQQEVVSSAVTKIQNVKSTVQSAADKARSILSSILDRTNSDAIGAAAIIAASDVTDMIARQSDITAQATAKAVATCELIVNVTCVVCPGAGSNPPTVTPAPATPSVPSNTPTTNSFLPATSYANNILSNIRNTLGVRLL